MPKIWGFDIDACSADELVEKTGAVRFSLPELSEGFLECLEEVEYNYNRRDMIEYEKRCLQTSQFAYLFFKHIYWNNNEDFIRKNPSINYKNGLDTLQFWSQPAAFYLLFEKLIEDRYYERKSIKEIYRFRIPKSSRKLNSMEKTNGTTERS